jgi:hypothetical protein
MAPNDFNEVHCDVYQTDTTSTPGPGHKDRCFTRDFLINPPTVGSGVLAFEAQDRLVYSRTRLNITAGPAIPLGTDLMLLDPKNLTVLDSVTLPGQGIYFYIDNLNRVVTSSSNVIQIYAINGNSYNLAQTYSLAAVVGVGDAVTSALPDNVGNIWFASTLGDVGYVIPSSGTIFSTTLVASGGNANERILKSIALDETGGAYIVSNFALYRFSIDPITSNPVVIWRTVYDRGTRIKSGQVFQGSGTTPTCFNDFEGNKFITIADNADPYMHVNVYYRLTGVLVAQREVFTKFPYANSCYNSLIAVNRTVIIENNYGNLGIAEGKNAFLTTAGSLTTIPGIARVDFNPTNNTSEVVWTNYDISIPSAISRLSTGDGLIYTYAKDKTSWYNAALDFCDGHIVNIIRVHPEGDMQGYLANNFFSGVANNRARNLYTPTLGGMVVWKY